MASLINKAFHVYKNNGMGGLARKSAGFTKKRWYRLKNSLRFAPETYEAKRLREEIGFISNEVFQITQEDIDQSKKVAKGPTPKIRTALWFVPYFDHFGFNGIQTIFRFIEKMSVEGVKNILVVYDRPAFAVADFKKQLGISFPHLENYEVIVFGDDK